MIFIFSDRILNLSKWMFRLEKPAQVDHITGYLAVMMPCLVPLKLLMILAQIIHIMIQQYVQNNTIRSFKIKLPDRSVMNLYEAYERLRIFLINDFIRQSWCLLHSFCIFCICFIGLNAPLLQTGGHHYVS